MTKIKKSELRDLVKGFYEERTETKITNKDADPFIEDVFLAIEQALIDGYDVPVGDIGTIKNKVRKARKGRNPQSGAEIEIPEAKTLGFTPSKHIKEQLNA